MSDWTEETPADPQDLSEGLKVIRSHDARLKAGAKTFALLRRLLFVVATGALAAAGSAVYQVFTVGRWVEQVESTRDAQRDTAAQLDRTEAKVRELDKSQALMQRDLATIQATTERIETKLEQDALERRRRPR